MRSLGCLALASLILIPISLTADTRLTLPIDADRLHGFLSENGITTKRGMLRALPDQVARRVLLISDSHTLHRSTEALPRVVHWSPDARFIMSISGQDVGNAPHAGSIEMIQVNERTNFWDFIANTREHEAYADLNIQFTMRGFSLRIPYGLPNTHFGARLGTRHAKVMFDASASHPTTRRWHRS